MTRGRPRATSGKKTGVRGAVGRRVQELREAAGWSQAELAQAAQVSRVYVGAVERAAQSATLDMVEKLATALRVEPARLLDDAPTPTKGTLTREDAFAAKIAEMTQGASAADLARFERVARGYFGKPMGGVR